MSTADPIDSIALASTMRDPADLDPLDDTALEVHPAGCECGQHPFVEPVMVTAAMSRSWDRQMARIMGSLSPLERAVVEARVSTNDPALRRQRTLAALGKPPEEPR